MGFLDRFRGSSGDGITRITRTTVKQHFAVTVPAAHAEAVQAGLEQWARSKGWAAVVKAERTGDQVKLSLEHDDSVMGPAPDVDGEGLSEELQGIVADAMKAS